MGRAKVRPEKSILKARIDAGNTYQAIADDYGVKKHTVSKWAKAYRLQKCSASMCGEIHPSATITADDARLIALLEGEMSARIAADKMETTMAVVYNIWRGRTWAHLSL